jgi:hypothetical protein
MPQSLHALSPVLFLLLVLFRLLVRMFALGATLLRVRSRSEARKLAGPPIRIVAGDLRNGYVNCRR